MSILRWIGGSYTKECHSPNHLVYHVNTYVLNECTKRGKLCYVICAQKGEQGMNELDVLSYFIWGYLIY